MDQYWERERERASVRTATYAFMVAIGQWSRGAGITDSQQPPSLEESTRKNDCFWENACEAAAQGETSVY